MINALGIRRLVLRAYFTFKSNEIVTLGLSGKENDANVLKNTRGLYIM